MQQVSPRVALSTHNFRGFISCFALQDKSTKHVQEKLVLLEQYLGYYCFQPKKKKKKSPQFCYFLSETFFSHTYTLVIIG